MTFNPQSNTKFHTVYSLRAKLWHIYGNRGMFSTFPHVYGIGSTCQELQQLGVQALPVKAVLRSWLFWGGGGFFLWVLPGRSAKV